MIDLTEFLLNLAAMVTTIVMAALLGGYLP